MMTKNIDLYWRSNKDWYHWDEDLCAFVPNDDAPVEAKESYERYLKQ